MHTEAPGRHLHIVMFFFDERNPCTFRGISVHLGFATSGISTDLFSTASTIFQISPPLVKHFSKFRMLRAGKFMLPPFLEH